MLIQRIFLLRQLRPAGMILFAAIAGALSSLGATELLICDVAVYGSTPAGIMAAIAASKAGAKTILISPSRHIGGMVSGGLSESDTGKPETIGGLALVFFQRAAKYYNLPYASFNFEPHVAELIFTDMLREANVSVLLDSRLVENTGVNKTGATISSVMLENGTGVQAAVFVDSSYEGDLMAQAGVSFTWGREARADYNESLAGVRPDDGHHQFNVHISAYDDSGALLAGISSEPRGDIGSGDRKVQAYNFRLNLTKNKANQIPFTKPWDYDPKQYALLAKLLAAVSEQYNRDLSVADVLNIARHQNQKADMNNNGGFSTDLIGGSWEYPNATYSRRSELWQAHTSYDQGFLYFLSSDPHVPKSLQDDLNQWGLSKDEFEDNAGWPYQLYIREARRMTGDFVMTQADIQANVSKPNPIGMGSYNSDSHHTQRFVTPDGTVKNEGNMEVPSKPYQIPYQVILPKRSEADNLLVPVCLSSTHVAFSTLRMEPVYMIIGQAAGVVASLAAKAHVAVQAIDTTLLTTELAAAGVVTSVKPVFSRDGVVNAASFVNGPIVPGELLSIFGFQVGPFWAAKSRVNSAGVVEPDTGGVRVLFDGVPAPILYAQQKQLNVVVPFAVVAPTTVLTIEYIDRSDALTLPVASSAPGIFTANALGTGQATAYNEDGTLNSVSRPAARGSVVTLTATGIGIAPPFPIDGQVTADIGVSANLASSVIVQIGDRRVPVDSVIWAPHLPAGVARISLRIPADLEPNIATPVVVVTGAAVSQGRVTIAIR
jgi:uncharacterized protein (TIGR03437 family)